MIGIPGYHLYHLFEYLNNLLIQLNRQFHIDGLITLILIGLRMMKITNLYRTKILINYLFLHKSVSHHLEPRSMKVTIEQEIGLQE